MIVFVTCLRHPATSNNYQIVEELLADTLTSVCAQRCDDFRVIVVGHVEPSFALHSKVQFVKVAFDPPPSTRTLTEKREVFRYDKGQKIAIAIRYAALYEPTHIVSFDADDFVSDRLAPFLLERGGCGGWYIQSGYVYSRKAMELKPVKGFHLKCGTSLIYARTDLKIPDCDPTDHSRVLELTGEEYFKKNYGSHVQAYQHFIRAGNWRPLPFPGAIYVVDTGENHSSNKVPAGPSLPMTSAAAQGVIAEFGLRVPPESFPLTAGMAPKVDGAKPAPLLKPSPADRAIIDAAEQMIAEKRTADAAALAGALTQSGGELAWLGRAVDARLALRNRKYEEAFGLLASLREARALALCPDMYLSAAFGCSADRGQAIYQKILETERSIGEADRWRIARVLLSRGRIAEAESLMSNIDMDRLPLAMRDLAMATASFLGERRRSVIPGCKAVLGVLDYKAVDPSRTSTNIGDYVQSLAFLSHLARFAQIRYRGGDDFDSIMPGLQQRVLSDLRDESRAGDVQLVRVSRDSSTFEDIPKGTWLFAFGWYMHRLFGGNFDLPLNSNVRPIFISFHINDSGLLTPAAIQQMRNYGPVGCRDWSTVDLLRSKGVPSFFSGCITTTLGTVFRQRADASDRGCVGIVEAKVAGGEFRPELIRRAHHGHPEARSAPMAVNLASAIDKLDSYTDWSHVVTSRLHCYLPCVSMGIPVDFRPKNDGDIRFAGLKGVTPGNIGLIRDPILQLMNTMLRLILDGAGEETVYSAWRQQTARLMEVAKPAVLR